MGETRLSWTGEDLQFLGFAEYGEAVKIGGEEDGVGAQPKDLLPLGLAGCASYDVVLILQKQRQDLRGYEVQITSEQEPDPPWAFTSIHLHYVITGDVDEHKVERAIDLAERKYCTVAASISDAIAFTHSFEVVRAAGA